jgi:hypothetical protein
MLVRNLCCYLISAYLHVPGSQDSVVGIATGYGLDDRWIGIAVTVGARIFSSPSRPDPGLGSSQPPLRWIPWALSLGVKWLGA